MNPKDRKYTKEHEWIKPESGNVAVVGITDFAQAQLGDIVFVYFPDDLSKVEQFKVFGEIESPKAVSELYAPATGRVLAVNKELQSRPELINQDPYGQGWMLRVEMSNPSELGGLMTAEEYEAMTQASSEG